MINRLDERLKKYSHKYFVKEFMKCKPNTEYNKLEKKEIWALVSFCILAVVLILLLICSSRLSACWYWYPLCLLVYAFVYWKLECRKMTVLSGMGSAYLEKHKDLKKKIQDYDLLATQKDRKYVDTIQNSYRAEIVKQCLGNDYNISTISALKNEISIQGVKFDCGFSSVCSLVALSIAFAAWEGPHIQQGWPIAVLCFFILLLVYTVCSVVRVLMWNFKCKKYKILRETLTFMLYNYM